MDKNIYNIYKYIEAYWKSRYITNFTTKRINDIKICITVTTNHDIQFFVMVIFNKLSLNIIIPKNTLYKRYNKK